MSLARDTADYGWMKSPRKNLITNADFSIAQRGVSFASPGHATHILDRFRYYTTLATGAVTVTQVASVSADVPFGTYLQVDVTTADTTIGAGEIAGVAHRIEAVNTDHLRMGTAGAETLTLSFWHKHTVTGAHAVTFRNSAGTRNYVAEYTQSVTNTWEEAEITLTLDTTGAWLTGEGVRGLELLFVTAGGSALQTTPNTWAATGDFVTSSTVNDYSSALNYFCLANVQLEVGREKTDFENLLVSEKLEQCQRYYEKSYEYDTYAGTAAALGAQWAFISNLPSGAHSWADNVVFRVRKATVPTVYTYSPATGTVGKVRDYTDVSDQDTTLGGQSESGFKCYYAVVTGITINAAYMWEADAEI